MTVKDLIEKLQQFPSDMLIGHDSDDWGVSEAIDIAKDTSNLYEETAKIKYKNYPYKRIEEDGDTTIELLFLVPSDKTLNEI